MSRRCLKRPVLETWCNSTWPPAASATFILLLDQYRDVKDDGQTWASGKCGTHYNHALFVWTRLFETSTLTSLFSTVVLYILSLWCFLLLFCFSGPHDSPVTSHDQSQKTYPPFSFVSPLSAFAHLISAWCICEIGIFTVSGKGTTGMGN